MNKKLLLMLFCCSFYATFAQSNLKLRSVDTKMDLGLYKRASDAQKQLQQNSKATPKLIGLLVRGDVKQIRKEVMQLGGVFKYATGNIASVALPDNQLFTFASSKFVNRIEAGRKLTLLNDTMVYRNHVVEVHDGMSPLLQAYDGKDIVVGIIDTGTDFNHPDFQDSTGKTRIKFLWDHTKSGTPPQLYGYGVEWTAAQIDSGLCTHDDAPNFGHGTHVAGIAAGNGYGITRNKNLLDSLINIGHVAPGFNGFKGVATASDLIVVAVDLNSYNTTYVADAVHYIFSKADSMGKPCVINISLGDYFGGLHDGKDVQTQLIDNLLMEKAGRVVVAAAGNEGKDNWHLSSNSSTNDTNFTWCSYPGGSTYMQIVGDSLTFENIQFAIGAEKDSPFELRGHTMFHTVATHLNTLIEDTLFVGGNSIGIVQSYGQKIGSSYSLEFNIIPDSTSYLWRLMYTGAGKFDAWSFDFVSTGIPTVGTYPPIANYVTPDNNQSMVSGFQNSDHIITVANYTNKNTYRCYNGSFVVDTNRVGGDLALSSSRGPTRDGRQKPDIAATGDFIFSTIVMSKINDYKTGLQVALAPGGLHVRGGGTSAASPVVTGVAALYLQKNPTATHLDVKNAIINCAYSDDFTGNNLPDNKWGHGKIDAFNVLKGCGLTTVNSELKNSIFEAFPNPSGSEMTIRYTLTKQTQTVSLVVLDVLGKEVKRINSLSSNGTVVLKQNEFEQGIYMCSLFVDGKAVQTHKLIFY